MIIISMTRFFLLLVFLSFVFPSGETVHAQDIGDSSSETEVNLEEFINPREIMGMYVINPLDRLLIVVFAGERQIDEYQKYVNSDGSIYLPFLEKDVKIGGLRILDAEDMLENLARTYIKEPRIVITVVSSYSQSVSTYGKIASTTVELKTPIRILQLLAKVGGPHDGALADSIRVISIDGSIRYFDFKKVNENPADKDNFFLRPGDIVFVPSEEDFSVMVLGEVLKSGAYPMKRGDHLLDALVKAGSWETNADVKNIRILRVINEKNVEIKKVNVNNIFNEGDVELNFTLQDGDIIYVPTRRTPFFLQSATSIVGIIYSLITSYAVYQALK